MYSKGQYPRITNWTFLPWDTTLDFACYLLEMGNEYIRKCAPVAHRREENKYSLNRQIQKSCNEMRSIAECFGYTFHYSISIYV